MIGTIFSRTINLWLRFTGRKVSLTEHPWLDGPIGGKYIGDTFYREFAEQNNLEIGNAENSGLMQDFSVFGSKLHSNFQHEVARFYEQTSNYTMEVWSQS
ncbi:MAG: hypothetical protein ACRC3B_17985, partial [Bacteroidia bacterium]